MKLQLGLILCFSIQTSYAFAVEVPAAKGVFSQLVKQGSREIENAFANTTSRMRVLAPNGEGRAVLLQSSSRAKFAVQALDHSVAGETRLRETIVSLPANKKPGRLPDTSLTELEPNGDPKSFHLSTIEQIAMKPDLDRSYDFTVKDYLGQKMRVSKGESIMEQQGKRQSLSANYDLGKGDIHISESNSAALYTHEDNPRSLDLVQKDWTKLLSPRVILLRVRPGADMKSVKFIGVEKVTDAAGVESLKFTETNFDLVSNGQDKLELKPQGHSKELSAKAAQEYFVETKIVKSIENHNIDAPEPDPSAHLRNDGATTD